MNNDIEIINNTTSMALETKHLTPELIMRWNKIGYNHAKKIYEFILKEYEEYEKEIKRLNNIINKARRKLGEHKYYSTPTEEQNKENEKIIEEVYQILHENLYKLKELKENNNE